MYKKEIELTPHISWKCVYCKNKNFESSSYCSACFVPIKNQPHVIQNELHKKQVLMYWTDLFHVVMPMNVHKVIWNLFEDKKALFEVSRPQRMKFGSFYSAGAFFKKYCDGMKWHKSLGEVDMDKYQNVNVYDCTSNKDGKRDGHILFHFGFMKETFKDGDYSFDYETKGVYYYIKDGTILEMLPNKSALYQVEMNASACLNDLRNEIIQNHGHIFKINNNNETVRIHFGKQTFYNLNDALSDIGICAQTVIEIEIIPKFNYLALGIVVDYNFVYDTFTINDLRYYTNDGLLPVSLPIEVREIALGIESYKGTEINVTRDYSCNERMQQLIGNLVQGTGYKYGYTVKVMDIGEYANQRIIWTAFIKQY